MNKLMLILTSLISILNFNVAHAAGAGAITDLIYPAINAVLFFGFLIFKLKKPITEMFAKTARDIEEFNELAEKKSKEAKIKLDMYQEKLQGIEKDVSKIKTETNADAEKLKQAVKAETEEKISRMERDAKNKLASEKNQIVKNIYSELVDKVIITAKKDIKSDGDKKSKATAKLLSTIN